jgi:hypothetical protein
MHRLQNVSDVVQITDTETVADDGLEMTLTHNGLKLPI